MRLSFASTAIKRLHASLGLCALCWVLPVSAAEQHFDVLDIGTHVYTNVTVTSKSPTHIFIQHSRGFASLKLSDLNDAALTQLGFERTHKETAAHTNTSLKLPSIKVPPIKMPAFTVAGTSVPAFEPKITRAEDKIIIEANGHTLTLDNYLLKAIVASAAIAYVIFCYLATLVCRRSGLKPSIGCWLPVIQWVFLFRAAGMSPWWILLWLLPVTSLIVWIIWCFKICRVRQKRFFTLFFLLFPLTTPLAFLYLALSSEEKKKSVSNKVQLTYQQAA